MEHGCGEAHTPVSDFEHTAASLVKLFGFTPNPTVVPISRKSIVPGIHRVMLTFRFGFDVSRLGLQIHDILRPEHMCEALRCSLLLIEMGFLEASGCCLRCHELNLYELKRLPFYVLCSRCLVCEGLLGWIFRSGFLVCVCAVGGMVAREQDGERSYSEPE